MKNNTPNKLFQSVKPRRGIESLNSALSHPSEYSSLIAFRLSLPAFLFLLVFSHFHNVSYLSLMFCNYSFINSGSQIKGTSTLGPILKALNLQVKHLKRRAGFAMALTSRIKCLKPGNGYCRRHTFFSLNSWQSNHSFFVYSQ